MLITEADFKKIPEEELYVGIVCPLLEKIEPSQKMSFDRIGLFYLYCLKGLMTEDNLLGLSEQESLLLKESLITNYFDTVCYDFSYVTILWQKTKTQWIDCISNRILEPEELVPEYNAPLSVYLSKDEIEITTIKDRYFLEEEYLSYVIPGIELEEAGQNSFQNPLDYHYRQYRHQEAKKGIEQDVQTLENEVKQLKEYAVQSYLATTTASSNIEQEEIKRFTYKRHLDFTNDIDGKTS